MVKKKEFIELSNQTMHSRLSLEQLKRMLRSVRGLRVIAILDEKSKDALLQREDPRNKGVQDVLKKNVVLLVAHDISFRSPQEALLENGPQGILFRSLPFPELVERGYADAIVASPGWDVHEFLQERFRLADGEASLLVGLE